MNWITYSSLFIKLRLLLVDRKCTLNVIETKSFFFALGQTILLGLAQFGLVFLSYVLEIDLPNDVVRFQNTLYLCECAR
jgi:hypothetical protein